MDEPQVFEWAKQLRGARERAGLSVIEMARRLGVKRQTIYQFESGVCCPTERTVKRYADALGFRVELQWNAP